MGQITILFLLQIERNCGGKFSIVYQALSSCSAIFTQVHSDSCWTQLHFLFSMELCNFVRISWFPVPFTTQKYYGKIMKNSILFKICNWFSNIYYKCFHYCILNILSLVFLHLSNTHNETVPFDTFFHVTNENKRFCIQSVLIEKKIPQGVKRILVTWTWWQGCRISNHFPP